MPIYDKEGKPINYLQDDYDPVSQTNVDGNIPEISKLKKSHLNIGAIKGEDRLSEFSSGYYYNQPISTIDENYDNFMGPVKSWADIEANRVNMQTQWTKAKTAVTSGVVGAAGIALQQMGYMSDPLSFTKALGWFDGQMLNPISKAMTETGNWLEQGSEEWMPIYENPDPDDLTDQLLKWNTASSVLKSTIGFLIPGAAAVKGGAILTKGAIGMGKMANVLGKLTRLPRLAKIENAAIRADRWRQAFPSLYPNLSKVVQRGGPLVVNTVGEAMFEANDAQEEYLRKISPGLISGTINVKEANNVGNDIAQNVYQSNMLKMGLDMYMMSRLGKALDPTRSLKSGLTNELISQAISAPMEGAEEMYQSIASKEGQYKALQELKKRNKNSEILKTFKRYGEWENPDVSTEFNQRVSDYLTQDDVLLEGIIGALSGPIQSFGARVLDKGPINAFRFKSTRKEEEKAADDLDFLKTKQRDLIKSQQGVGVIYKMMEDLSTTPEDLAYASKGLTSLGNPDISVRLDRAETVARLTELTEGNKQKEEIVRRNVYNSMVLDAIGKGTLESLEAHAAEVKDTDSDAATLHKYIQENKKKLKRVSHLRNKEEVLYYINQSETFNATYDVLEDDLSKLTVSPEYKDRQTGELTETAKVQVKSIQEDLKGLQKKINVVNEVIKDKSSRKNQIRLANFAIEREIRDTALEGLSKVNTINALDNFDKVYPDLMFTQEYAAAVARVTDGKPTPKSKKFKLNFKGISKRVPEKVTEATKKITKQVTTKAKEVVKTVKEKIAETDIIQVTTDLVDNAVDTAIAAKEMQIPPDMISRIKSDIKKAVKGSVAEKTFNNLVDSFINNNINNTSKVKNAKKNEQYEVNKEVRRTKNTGEVASKEKLPEELFQEIADIVLEQKNLVDQADQVKEETEGTNTQDQTLREQIITKGRELIKSINKQIQRIAVNILPKVVSKFAATAVQDVDNKFGEAIKKNFDNFVSYLEVILSEEAIARNWNLIKNIFKGWNKNALLHKSYKAYQDYLASVEDNSNNKVVVEKEKEAEATNMENEVGRISFNKRPSQSIAHLSEAYIEGIDPRYGYRIEAKEEGKYDISPIVYSGDYNGGNPISFIIDIDYPGTVIGYPWEQVRAKIFKEGQLVENADAIIKSMSDGRFESVYDIIPIRINGTNKETLGYMHLPEWIENRTVEIDDPKNPANNVSIEEEVANLRLNRKSVIDSSLSGKEVKGKVTNKVFYYTEDPTTGIGFYKGFAFSRKRGGSPTSEAVPEDLPMGVVTSKKVHSNQNISPNNILNYDNVRAYTGSPIVLIPLGKYGSHMMYHAETLATKHLTEEIYKPALETIKAFISQEHNEISKMYENKGINVLTLKGINQVLSSFTNVLQDADKFGKVSFETAIKNKKASIVKLQFVEDNGNFYLKHGITSANRIDDTNLEAGLQQLESYMVEGSIKFNADVLKLKSRSKKVSIVMLDKQGSPKMNEVNYTQFVKENTTTWLKGRPINNDPTKLSYTIQNIVEFAIDPEFKTTTPKTKKAETKTTKTIKKEGIVTKQSGRFTEGDVRKAINTLNKKLLKSGIDSLIDLKTDFPAIAALLNIPTNVMDELMKVVDEWNVENITIILNEYAKSVEDVESLPGFDEATVEEQDDLREIAEREDMTIEILSNAINVGGIERTISALGRTSESTQIKTNCK